MYYSIVTTCDCSSELLERLLRSNRFGHLQHVEPYSLGEWSALSNGDQIPQVHITKARRHVSREGLVSLLVPLVLLDEVEVIPSQHDCAIHLHRLHDPSEDATSDADVAGERALLVDVRSLDSFPRCLKTQPHILHKSLLLRLHCFADYSLLVQEDGSLFLESSFCLLGHDY